MGPFFFQDYFYREIGEYAAGFGRAGRLEEHWLGLENIHR